MNRFPSHLRPVSQHHSPNRQSHFHSQPHRRRRPTITLQNAPTNRSTTISDGTITNRRAVPTTMAPRGVVAANWTTRSPIRSCRTINAAATTINNDVRTTAAPKAIPTRSMRFYRRNPIMYRNHGGPTTIRVVRITTTDPKAIRIRSKRSNQGPVLLVRKTASPDHQRRPNQATAMPKHSTEAAAAPPAPVQHPPKPFRPTIHLV